VPTLGTSSFKREDIALLRLAEEASSVVEVLAEEKRQQIDIAGDANLLVSVDRLILRQAIVNLLDNAIKYSPPGSQILVRVQSGGDQQVFLDVIDQGPGIPANISPTSSTAFSGSIKHERGNGAVLALACPSLDGRSRLTAAR